MDFIFDPNFDATQDVDYWKYWWDPKKGNELLGTRHVVDPDSKSKKLHEFHKTLWSKKLPDGRLWDLKTRWDNGYSFDWHDGKAPRSYSSDSLCNSFRWKNYGMLDVLKEVRNKIENEMHLDYHKWLEDYVRKLYMMGGMIIFPKRPGGINSVRAISRVKDRVDLTFECIRRWYAGESNNPMKHCLDTDADFLNLFKDFKGYVDFFLLQDIVTDDYKHVKNLLGEKEFCDDFFKIRGEVTIPKNVTDYIQWHDNLIDFVEKRNKRIENWINNQK